MIKTRSSKVPALAEYVRYVTCCDSQSICLPPLCASLCSHSLQLFVLPSSNHPYEVAEVISLPIDQGNPPYLKWIGQVVPE